MSPFWKQVDLSHGYRHIRQNETCYYAREFKPGLGYQGGEANSLVLNFKKSGEHKNKAQWHYRQKAVAQFAAEMAAGMFTENSKAVITAIPSSCRKDDPKYSNRFEDLAGELQKKRPGLVIEWPIEIINTVTSSHHGGTRKPDEIIANYRWNGFAHGVPQTLVVIDDVLTTGANFRAFCDFLRSNGYNGNIAGIFWARVVRPTAEEEFASE